MKTAILGAAAALTFVAAGSPGLCATQPQAQSQAQPQAQAQPQTQAQNVQAPSRLPVTQHHDNVESAAETPAEDLNLKQTPIPDVLQHAAANPYDMKGLDGCPGIDAEMARLDAALGPDRDVPPPKDSRTLNEKRGDTAGTVLKTGVEAIIPYRGVIRYVSGASKYEKAMNDAISAGYERRGYLKGMGLRMNCAPPGAPYWFKPAAARAPVARTAPAPRR